MAEDSFRNKRVRNRESTNSHVASILHAFSSFPWHIWSALISVRSSPSPRFRARWWSPQEAVWFSDSGPLESSRESTHSRKPPARISETPPTAKLASHLPAFLTSYREAPLGFFITQGMLAIHLHQLEGILNRFKRANRNWLRQLFQTGGLEGNKTQKGFQRTRTYRKRGYRYIMDMTRKLNGNWNTLELDGLSVGI